MSNTINNSIPFVPENTIDPAAGLNISLNAIDAMLQVLVLTVGANTPPVGVEGERHIVGTAPTGAWAGQANKLARFLNGVWIFYDARYVVNSADGALYVRSGSVWTLFAPAVADNSVTNAKLADVATQTIKGRTTAGTGDPEDLTATQVRTLINVADGANAYTHPNHSGDVTSVGDGAQTIAANAVTNSKAADMAVNTIKGRITAGTGDPEDLTAAQARGVLGLATTDSPTFNALTLTNGQIVFPATQVPSANANTLDDYEEGTWTPVITFATPGDLNIVYSTQVGTYTKIGRMVFIGCVMATSTFTHTDASGNLRISGLPFTVGTTQFSAAFQFGTFTFPASTTYVTAVPMSGQIYSEVVASGSTVAGVLVTASNHTSGTNSTMRATIQYSV